MQPRILLFLDATHLNRWVLSSHTPAMKEPTIPAIIEVKPVHPTSSVMFGNSFTCKHIQVYIYIHSMMLAEDDNYTLDRSCAWLTLDTKTIQYFHHCRVFLFWCFFLCLSHWNHYSLRYSRIWMVWVQFQLMCIIYSKENWGKFWAFFRFTKYLTSVVHVNSKAELEFT